MLQCTEALKKQLDEIEIKNSVFQKRISSIE